MKPTRIRTLPDDYRERLRHRLEIKSREVAGGCIEWTGALDRWGYGKIKLRHQGETRWPGAHRAAWLAFRGDIEGDLVVDHLCRNHACVNVDHMELVSNGENGRRGSHEGKAGRSGTRAGQLIHSCGKHAREDGYLRMQRDGYLRWECRICRRARLSTYRARLRAA